MPESDLTARQEALLRMNQELDTDSLFNYADACLDENPPVTRTSAESPRRSSQIVLNAARASQQRRSNEGKDGAGDPRGTHGLADSEELVPTLVTTPSRQPAANSSEPSPGGESTTASEAGMAAIGDDSALRFQRARMSVLQQQVDHFSAQAQDLEAQLRSSEEARKHEAEDHRRHARASAALKEKLEKETSLRSNAETEAERLRGEVSSLRRELEESRRVCRGADSESKSNGVRLNRALEDAKKYKELLSLERDKKAEDGDSVRQQLAKVEAKATKLERQKAELLGAFKKQLKLIDVLKRQKVHIEAARALAFTEEEFMKTLDWGSV